MGSGKAQAMNLCLMLAKYDGWVLKFETEDWEHTL
jgi:hypothetical protein